MADPDGYDALKSGASGAATGASIAGPWGAVIGGVAGAATPFISKALGGLFGVDEAEEAQKRAYAGIQRVAQGGTTQAQAGAAYARANTLQNLQALANRGTAQQQAGLQRQAMQQAPEVQAKYASQLADLRAMEQSRAQSQLAYYEGERARQDAARKRAALSGAIESGVSMGTKLGMAAGSPSAADDEALKKALGIGAPEAPGGISSAEAGAALFGTPAAAGAAGGAAAAPAAGRAIGSALAAAPGVVKGGALAGPATSDDWAKVMGAPEYSFQMRGAVKDAGDLAAEEKMAQQYAALARTPGTKVRTPLPGVTASEQAMRGDMFDNLAGQRSGLVSGLPATAPANFTPTATPKNVGAISKNLQEDRIDPGLANMLKTQPAESTPTSAASFPAPDMTRSSYAGASYEPPRETMNNTQMASQDRMRKSLEGQVGPISIESQLAEAARRRRARQGSR